MCVSGFVNLAAECDHYHIMHYEPVIMSLRSFQFSPSARCSLDSQTIFCRSIEHVLFVHLETNVFLHVAKLNTNNKSVFVFSVTASTIVAYELKIRTLLQIHYTARFEKIIKTRTQIF